MNQRTRDRVLGLLYGIPMGLALTAGLFHILVYKKVLQSELVMGVYQVAVAALFLIGFIFHLTTLSKD